MQSKLGPHPRRLRAYGTLFDTAGTAIAAGAPTSLVPVTNTTILDRPWKHGSLMVLRFNFSGLANADSVAITLQGHLESAGAAVFQDIVGKPNPVATGTPGSVTVTLTEDATGTVVNGKTIFATIPLNNTQIFGRQTPDQAATAVFDQLGIKLDVTAAGATVHALVTYEIHAETDRAPVLVHEQTVGGTSSSVSGEIPDQMYSQLVNTSLYGEA